MNNDTVGALLKCFAPISVGLVQTPVLCAMTNRFCALALSVCACDMDHDTVVNDYLLSLSSIYEKTLSDVLLRFVL